MTAEAKDKMKLKTLVNSSAALGVLSNTALPAATSFRLRKLLKAANENFEDYDKTRMELCRKYGVLNEKTNQFEFEPENREKFDAEFTELLESEVELSFEPIKSFDLGDATISAAVLMQLDWLIVE